MLFLSVTLYNTAATEQFINLLPSLIYACVAIFHFQRVHRIITIIGGGEVFLLAFDAGGVVVSVAGAPPLCRSQWTK